MLRKMILFLVLAVVVAQAPAFAGNAMVGSWRGSSGITVQIPEGSADFDLTVIEFGTGRRIVHKARWIETGRLFEWTDRQGSRHTATLDPKNPDRIEDVNSAYPRSPAYWYRLRGTK